MGAPSPIQPNRQLTTGKAPRRAPSLQLVGGRPLRGGRNRPRMAAGAAASSTAMSGGSPKAVITARGGAHSPPVQSQPTASVGGHTEYDHRGYKVHKFWAGTGNKR